MRGIIGLAAGAAMAAGAAAAQDAARGEETYHRYCAVCHGIDATGAGPMAPILTIQPTDLTRLAVTAGGVFPMLRAASRIDGRDPLVAHGSPMPVYGGFFEGRQVSVKLPDGQPMMVTETVADLLAWLQTIQRTD
ncbi:MAG: c-type cytochrome [Paracoccaceae bacterium]|nr:MAG: c-type cytochrome [Paracoccaceae bacterium]